MSVSRAWRDKERRTLRILRSAAKHDDGVDVVTEAKFSMQVHFKIPDGSDWHDRGRTDEDRELRSLMLTPSRVAPHDLGFLRINLQPVRCHPRRDVVDTDGHLIGKRDGRRGSTRSVNFDVVGECVWHQVVTTNQLKQIGGVQ